MGMAIEYDPCIKCEANMCSMCKLGRLEHEKQSEEEMHGQSDHFMLEQAIETYKRFMAEHDAALAKRIFEEIESVLFTVARPCPSADGTIIAKHSKDFHIRREDYYIIKEKYTKGGVEE